MAQDTTKVSDHLKEGARLAWRRLTLPFRLLMTLGTATLAILTVCFFLLSLALPVVTVLSESAFGLASWVADGLSSAPNVLERQAKVAGAELAAKDAELAAEKIVRKEASKAAEMASARALKAEAKVAGLTVILAENEAKLAAKVFYRGEKRALSEIVADTSARVAGRVTKIMTTDIASLAGEIVPYVGAAAVVGLTAWDLDQSCEMMKDMHEMDVAFNPDHAIDSREVCGLRVPTLAEVWQSVWDGVTGLPTWVFGPDQAGADELNRR